MALADFPQYNTKSSGLIEEYLSGKYGQADDIDSYKASIFYAVDRYDASFKIREWLAQGKIVIFIVILSYSKDVSCIWNFSLQSFFFLFALK